MLRPFIISNSFVWITFNFLYVKYFHVQTRVVSFLLLSGCIIFYFLAELLSSETLIQCGIDPILEENHYLSSLCMILSVEIFCIYFNKLMKPHYAPSVLRKIFCSSYFAPLLNSYTEILHHNVMILRPTFEKIIWSQ